MEFTALAANADFAASVIGDRWKRKEEKPVIPDFKFSESCSDGSTSSIGSVSSSNLCDDASSPFSSFSSSLSSESSSFSQTEAHQQQHQLLPMKKGLSKFYQGKSRTFTSLSDVKCIEDLAKGENGYRKKEPRVSLSPKAIISKKIGRSSFASLVSKAD